MRYPVGNQSRCSTFRSSDLKFYTSLDAADHSCIGLAVTCHLPLASSRGHPTSGDCILHVRILVYRRIRVPLLQ
jgi:hypothetical protein